MRLSDNPFSRVSWFYTWFFRAIPRYVLLTIMGHAASSSKGAGDRGALRLEDHRMARLR